MESIRWSKFEYASFQGSDTFRANVDNVVKGPIPVSFDSEVTLLNSVVFPLSGSDIGWRMGHGSGDVEPNQPAISILKPIHGRDPGFYACIRSHAAQRYPEFEILFGVSDAGDPGSRRHRELAAGISPTADTPCTSYPPPRPTQRPGYWPNWRATPVTRFYW